MRSILTNVFGNARLHNDSIDLPFAFSHAPTPHPPVNVFPVPFDFSFRFCISIFSISPVFTRSIIEGLFLEFLARELQRDANTPPIDKGKSPKVHDGSLKWYVCFCQSRNRTNGDVILQRRSRSNIYVAFFISHGLAPKRILSVRRCVLFVQI